MQECQEAVFIEMKEENILKAWSQKADFTENHHISDSYSHSCRNPSEIPTVKQKSFKAFLMRLNFAETASDNIQMLVWVAAGLSEKKYHH